MTAAACTVHVVDDDASWRKSVARLLSAAGYRVALYEVAEHFLESANIDEPGCILLDMRMPGLTGLQLNNDSRKRGIRYRLFFFPAMATFLPA